MHNISNKNKLKNEMNNETKRINLYQTDINKKKIKINRLNNYKDSLREKEDKECTFSPKLNDNYNKKYIIRIKRVEKNNNENKKANNSVEIKDKINEDNIYNRNQKWKNLISKRNNIIKKEDKYEKFSFAPDINKIKNINLIFKDNSYSNYWLKHNKFYISRRLKFINNNQNNITISNYYLSNTRNRKKISIEKINHSLDNNDRKIKEKLNINYIKKLLHEELQSTKLDDLEEEIN